MSPILAADQIALGRPVVVIDSLRDEGDLVFAAQSATPELMAFAVRHTSGFVCVAMLDADADRLDLPALAVLDHTRPETAYSVSVDARDRLTTGISATDRSHTAQLLAGLGTQPGELTRPGHIVVVRARRCAATVRADAAVTLTELAGLRAVAVHATVVSRQDPTRMAGRLELREFAQAFGLATVEAADLALADLAA